MVTPPKITLIEAKHKGWDAWRLQRGRLELVLVPQVGGRIMSMIWRGRDLSFTQPEREGQVEDVRAVKDVRARKREMGFPLWGGDKTWLSPQTGWTDGVPFLDLDSGPYDLIVEHTGPEAAVVRMTSHVCRETGVQITRTVTISSDSQAWFVTHTLRNRSSHETRWGLWDVSMLYKPGRVYVPRGGTSRHPSGVKTFEEEGESIQVRDKVVHELGSLAVIDCIDTKAFKFGVDAQEGWMLGVLEVAGLGLVGHRKQVPVHRDKPYGHGCIAEVYNSDQYPYFEMEIHGPVISLGPGEVFELKERQALFDVPCWPQSEDEVRQYMELRS